MGDREDRIISFLVADRLDIRLELLGHHLAFDLHCRGQLSPVSSVVDGRIRNSLDRPACDAPQDWLFDGRVVSVIRSGRWPNRLRNAPLSLLLLLPALECLRVDGDCRAVKELGVPNHHRLADQWVGWLWCLPARPGHILPPAVTIISFNAAGDRQNVFVHRTGITGLEPAVGECLGGSLLVAPLAAEYHAYRAPAAAPSSAVSETVAGHRFH